MHNHALEDRRILQITDMNIANISDINSNGILFDLRNKSNKSKHGYNGQSQRWLDKYLFKIQNSIQLFQSHFDQQ